ncbi:hypothetical protein KBX37_30405 [Micromonospora sp. U56]|uniref:hypothetical protein n=1 Tax=Micromonospora sp. U56 TaxID=2824900 RepID=UPI001B38716A|nr:hypothetical protein [Micromonospora sp. U56]MBQ0897325.1 hypothetical protein [Micromonospora sp. U56]
MPDFRANFILRITPPGDASLPAFVNRLRNQLVQVQQRSDCILATTVSGITETQCCEVTLTVKADDITTAPIAAGRAVRSAANQVAPGWHIAIGRITIESPHRRPTTLADLLPPSRSPSGSSE